MDKKHKSGIVSKKTPSPFVQQEGWGFQDIFLSPIEGDNKCFFRCMVISLFGCSIKEDCDKKITQVKELCIEQTKNPKLKAHVSLFLETKTYDKDVMHPDYFGGHLEASLISQAKKIIFYIVHEPQTPREKPIFTRVCFPEKAKYTNVVFLFWTFSKHREARNHYDLFFFRDSLAQISPIVSHLNAQVAIEAIESFVNLRTEALFSETVQCPLCGEIHKPLMKSHKPVHLTYEYFTLCSKKFRKNWEVSE